MTLHDRHTKGLIAGMTWRVCLGCGVSQALRYLDRQTKRHGAI